MLNLVPDAAAGRPEGPAAAAQREMERFAEALQRRIAADRSGNRKLRTWEIWTNGLIVSLIELEESRQAARHYGEKVKETIASRLEGEELLHYRRYVYFYKNAFIRVFSQLDKLGTFMNGLMGLETERIKAFYSYFTVLRNLRQNRRHSRLSDELDRLKTEYRAPIDALRQRRNTEVHIMNVEMEDDLLQLQAASGAAVRLEDISAQLADLDRGCLMVVRSLALVFREAEGIMIKSR